MTPIKHIIYENGVKQIFKLIVVSGNHQGEYIIKKPNGWDSLDSVIDINDELFYVENFLIGDSEKLEFSEYSSKEAFNLIKNVKQEQGGDGQIKFKWLAIKDGVEYDLLKDNFEINLNKYVESFDNSMRKIEIELIKSEAQNKLFNRNETTVNIFDTKDLDENEITPAQSIDIGYKKGDKVLSNFYTYDISQNGQLSTQRSDQFFRFVRASDYEFGDNNNNEAGYNNQESVGKRTEVGPFVATNITRKGLKVEFSNFHFTMQRSDGGYPQVELVIQVRNGGTVVKEYKVRDSINNPSFPGDSEIKIDNLIIPLDEPLYPGQNIFITVKNLDGSNFRMFAVQNNSSIEITTNMESPLVRTKSIRLIEAVNQLAKSYTNGEISVLSRSLGVGGMYHDTSISTGMYLRGLPPKYLLQKIKTSLKSVTEDGASKLMALGYDVVEDNIIIENIDYFFKEIKNYDLSEKTYIQSDFKLENDIDLALNNLLFGSKKYSTNNKFDIQNFNTSEEISTPIKSNKAKLDKQTDLIIDPYKIQELIEDKTTSTNDSDDDLVLIDMVNVTNHWDSGVFENTTHRNESGNLLLTCISTPFDMVLIEVGVSIEITEGLNVGNHTVLEIDGAKMKLTSTGTIQEGTVDTPIKYQIENLTKNRTNEGFTGTDETIRDVSTTTNIRHNPKYQMARWFPFFGGGLRKKSNSELLKVTNYKNNSAAKMTIVAGFPELANELQGEVIVGDSETLGRMRDYKATFFTGDVITITFKNILFEEFIAIYENWRYGLGNDRLLSRGYLTLNTPDGILDVYPFGTAAFKHSKLNNTLTIKGKIKGKSVDSPTLLNVHQIDRNTVSLVWDYNGDYVNPHIKIQFSPDGTNWTTIKEVDNVKIDTIQSDLFNDFMTGDNVYFKVVVSSSDIYNKSSNTLSLIWQYNDWVIREISRTENINCGNSYLDLVIKGTANLTFKWFFGSYPGGGSAKIVDAISNSELLSFNSPYGLDYEENIQEERIFNNDTLEMSIMIKNTDKSSDLKILKCVGDGIEYQVNSTLTLSINDEMNNEVNVVLECITRKKFKDTGIVEILI